MTDDSHIPRYILNPAYEATARRRYLRRFGAELEAWREDRGPEPQACDVGESPEETN